MLFFLEGGVFANHHHVNDNKFIFSIQNAECIMKEVPPVVMRQVHATGYRSYVKSVLMEEGAQKNDATCDMPHCLTSNARRHQRCVQCTLCGRWTLQTANKSHIGGGIWMCVLCCHVPLSASLSKIIVDSSQTSLYEIFLQDYESQSFILMNLWTHQNNIWAADILKNHLSHFRL